MAEDYQASIHRIMDEMAETRGKLKALRKAIADVVSGDEDAQNLTEELKDLASKRNNLKELLNADPDFKKLSSEVEEFKFKLKDLQEILSHHLVTYHNETNKTEFTDSTGEVHQIIISAKIGKV